MIGVDTNVVVRFLVDDDPSQAASARKVFARFTEAEPGFIGREVLVELVWVLRRAYGVEREDIGNAIQGLLNSLELTIEEPEDVGWAIAQYRDGQADFADLMIAAGARRAGCVEVLTFDRKACRIESVHLIDERSI